MLGDLNSDIIGTNPKFPKIVNHDWLNVDLSKYDNYPSDNNPVRIVPKLSDLWNHAPGNNGINLIPNNQVMPLGIRSSEKDQKAVTQVIREAKKAIMSGLKGRALSQHIRSRFSVRHIEAASEELKKLSGEVGLMGNVYVDASAFNTFEEAEQFLKNHRNRLAQDILLDTETMSPNVISVLASSFHKNVVSAVKYDKDLFKKYKMHLVAADRIPKDFVIDSKESLRQAFLYEKSDEPIVKKKADTPSLTKDQVEKTLKTMSENQAIQDVEASDAIVMSKVIPVISFVREQLSKGKTAGDLKGMVSKRFVMEDIKAASCALKIVLSKEGLTDEHINRLMKERKITLVLGKELKRIGKKFPIREIPIGVPMKSAKQVGIKGFFHALSGKQVSDSNDKLRNASVEALKKGIEPSQIRVKLIEKLSRSEADQVLSDAVVLFNSSSVGAVANKLSKPKKAYDVPELKTKQTLPDPGTIVPQTKEILSFFEGSKMDNIEIDPTPNVTSIEVEGLSGESDFGKVL